MIKVPFRTIRNGTFIMLEKNVIALRKRPANGGIFKALQRLSNDIGATCCLSPNVLMSWPLVHVLAAKCGHRRVCQCLFF